MKKYILEILMGTGIVSMLTALAFVGSEPAMVFGGLATSTSQFKVTETITPEISFTTTPSNVTLASLPGITGGTANGGTQFVVLTNNTLGYTLTLLASSSPWLVGNASSTNTIPDYVPSAAATPDFSFTTPANRARFGYTVEATTTTDLSANFKDNGSNTCGGANTLDTADACWYNGSTTAVTLINRSSATAASGSTSTIKFRLVINSNPVPAVQQDTYVATTTLTATTN